MRNKIILSAFILFFTCSFSFAQKLTVGVENGINFSNVHGSIRNGKWSALTGPVNGLFIKHPLGNWFCLQSGVNFTALYYSNNIYPYFYNNYYYSGSPYLSSSMLLSDLAPPPYRNYDVENTRFSFIRVPLQLKFKTPGRLSFEMGGGAYYAFLVNDEFRGKDKDLFQEEYIDDNFPPLNDWGWLFSAGLNYDLTNRLTISLASQSTYGQKVYLENGKAKNGSTEITFGLGYKFFPDKKKALQLQKNDTLGNRLTLLPHAGLIISTTQNPDLKKHYLNSAGLSSGMSLKINLDETLSLITGAWFERKGYGLDYTGQEKIIYVEPENDNTSSRVNTEVDLDYLTFPFLFDFKLGRHFSANLNLGLYYSILQNAQVRGEYIYKYVNENTYSLQKEYVNKKIDGWFKNDDVGFLSGIRFKYPVFPETHLFFGINYSHGVINVVGLNDKDSPSLSSDQKIFNSSFSILFGIEFPSFKTDAL